MKIGNLKSIENASEKDMLRYIFSSQLVILRRLDFLERNQKKHKIQNHKNFVKGTINKIDPFLDRIDDYLKLDDLEKGQLRF